MEQMVRILVSEDMLGTAMSILDDLLIINEADGGGRIMVRDNDLGAAVSILEENGIDADII